MKKLSLLLAVLLVLGTFALADEPFDGTVYDAYRPVFDESFLRGWEVMGYIEPEGLLLSATKREAEISVTIQESGLTPEAFLEAHVAGVSRYGKDIERGAVSSMQLSGYEKAAQVSYSYRSVRDSGDGDVYRVDAVAAKLKSGYLLTFTQTRWGDDASKEDFLEGFVKRFTVEQTAISTTYYALLSYCEYKDGGVYVTLDFCDMDYQSLFGESLALDPDPTEYVYRLRNDAEVYVPVLSGALYSLQRVGADETEISIAIESYYNINEAHAVYLALFDRNGDVIRLQHYNAF